LIVLRAKYRQFVEIAAQQPLDKRLVGRVRLQSKLGRAIIRAIKGTDMSGT
jgi:hypothetical protein